MKSVDKVITVDKYLDLKVVKNYSDSEIADEFFIARSILADWKKENKIKHEDIQYKKFKLINQYMNAGLNQEKTARKLGITSMTVHKLLKKFR